MAALTSPESLFREELQRRVSLTAAVLGVSDAAVSDAAADAEEAGGKDSKEAGKCVRTAPSLQDALLTFKVPLFFAKSLHCTADCDAWLEPIRAGACEESVRDAVGKCTEKKDALVHLKKSLQQGRKDLGRALAARAKMATKASDRERRR